MAWTASAPLEGGMACRVTRRANARRASCLFSPEEANAVHKRPPAEVDELNCPDKTAAGLRCCQNCHTFDLWPLCFDRCMGFFSVPGVQVRAKEGHNGSTEVKGGGNGAH